MKLLYATLLILTAHYCEAQAPYKFYHLFLEHGLSDSRVADIVQDKYGFMWFATPNGLNRYDGFKIKKFHSGKQLNGLTSNNITSLHTARNGDLWVGTGTGMLKYNFSKETFSHFDTLYKEGADIDKIIINDIAEDKFGNIYAATDKGVFRYTSSDQKWKNLNDVFATKGILKRVRRLKFFSDELLYCATSGNLPIYEINIRTNTYDSLLDRSDTIPPNMYGMEKLNDQEMLGGLLSNGFLKFNVATRKISGGSGVLKRSDSIRYNTVYDILKDSRGRIWMASYYFRLAEYLPEQDRIITYDKDPYNPYGYDGNSAICVYEDRQHNLWIGTAAKGVYRFNPDNNAVMFHAGLDRGPVFSLNYWDSNTLFVGTEKGPAFYESNGSRGKEFSGYANMGINGPVEYVLAGIPDKNGKHFWMGSERLGLARYDRTSNEFKNFSRITKPYQLNDDGINNLVQQPDGNLFLIGFGKPVLFNTKTFEVTSIRNDSANAVLKLTGVSSICEDEKQNIWLAVSGGKFYEYDPRTKKLTDRSSLLSSLKELKGIFKVIRQDGAFYLATNVGLIILKDNQKLQHFLSEKPENSLDGVRGLLPDGEHIWFGNSRRIGRLHVKSGKVIYLGEREGLSNILLYPRTFIKSPQGTILIGSNRGYYEIFPDRIKEDRVFEAPYLTGFRIYDRPLIADEAISGIKQIRLKHSENFFSFDLSTFNYNEFEDLQYAYKLEGFDKDWQYIGKLRSGSYTNVPGGDYTLRLKAGNSSGQWNENGQQIKIHVERHFLQTWWFWLTTVLLVTALLIFLYRRRIAGINKNARLRSDYEIKLNELENSALRTQMNPHFIFNSLNTINSFISNNETIQAHQYISKFSKLIRYILDHSRKRQILLSDELEVLNLYIQIERIRFENKFEYEILVADGIDTSSIELPPLIIQPFVENAILHGLLPMDRTGLLKIKLYRDADMLYCTVEDNGIGREKAKQLKKNPLVQHKSHGIDITLKRIELFNKEHGKTSTVTITDLPEGGTKVEIPVAWEESF